jgi:hypothetical protein
VRAPQPPIDLMNAPDNNVIFIIDSKWPSSASAYLKVLGSILRTS